MAEHFLYSNSLFIFFNKQGPTHKLYSLSNGNRFLQRIEIVLTPQTVQQTRMIKSIDINITKHDQIEKIYGLLCMYYIIQIKIIDIMQVLKIIKIPTLLCEE